MPLGWNDYLIKCPNLSNDNGEFGPRQQPGVWGALVCFFEKKQADMWVWCCQLLRAAMLRYRTLVARTGIYSFPVLEARSPRSRIARRCSL